MEHLENKGLYIDELQKLRVMDPDLAQQTQSLRDECGNFVTQTGEFQKMADTFIELSQEVSKQVEEEKMKTLGSRNLLKSVTKAREQEQQQLQALIYEKKMELERLRLQYEALTKVESDQQEFIEQLILQQ